MSVKTNEIETIKSKPNLKDMRFESLMKSDDNNIEVNINALQINENFAEIEKELVIHLAKITVERLING